MTNSATVSGNFTYSIPVATAGSNGETYGFIPSQGTISVES